MSLGIACDSCPVSLVCHKAVGSCRLTLVRSCGVEFSLKKRNLILKENPKQYLPKEVTYLGLQMTMGTKRTF